MSYKSQVVIRIESEKETLDKFVRELNARLINYYKEKLGKLYDDSTEYWELKIFYENNIRLKQDAVILDFPNYEWCNYEIVDKMLFDYYLNDLISYHLVRIGEDFDDIEEETYGDLYKNLYIKREIIY